jgi:site-specific DNA-methyltransferase (adenine-specific)/modification methylase
MRKEVIGDATLYLGDCLEVLPTLGKVDAVVTDPPYGIGEARGKNASRRNMAIAKDYGVSAWDDSPCNERQLEAMRRVSIHQVIFGGNFFRLPPTSCWLIWDKMNGTNDFADCEMAWTNLPGAVRLKRHMWNGMLRDSERGVERMHPTQKPITIMEWCITHLPPDCQTILDPFMGSGTTGVACVRLGRKFIGIEIDEGYFDVACRRIEEAQRQGQLFTEPAKPLVQEAMDV